MPKPDRCYYLHLDSETQVDRGGFGDERYEKSEFQKKVQVNFNSMIDQDKDGLWKLINAARSIDEVFQEISIDVKNLMKTIEDTDVGKLWV